MAKVESSSVYGFTSYTQILEATEINHILASNQVNII